MQKVLTAKIDGRGMEEVIQYKMIEERFKLRD